MKATGLISAFSALNMTFWVSASPVQAQEIQFIPEKLHYSFTLVDTCAPRKICAVNLSSEAIFDPEFTLGGDEVFEIQGKFQNCPDPLLPGEACIVYVNFCPEFVRDYDATLSFSGSSRTVNLEGEGVSPSF